MALTGTDRGQGAVSIATTSYNLLPGSNFTAGALAVICVSADNSGNASNNINSIDDSLGNTWTKRVSAIFDPAAANAGIQGAIFTSPQNGGALTTSATISIAFGASTTAKSFTLMEVTAASGYFAAYGTGAASSGTASAVPAVTTTSINLGALVVAAIFNEYGTGQTVTQDADTTNGSWSAQQTAEVGSTAAGNTIASQRKVVTATATQTYNPTLGTSSDSVLGWITVAEYSNVSGTSATTNAADTSTASGTVEDPAAPITGTSATTNANDAGTATGTEAFVGTSATTNANDSTGGGGTWPSGRTLHFDFSDVGTLTLDGSYINAAADQSGNGYDAAPTGGSEVPISEVDSIIGQAATFDGVNDSLRSASGTVSAVTNATEWTLVVRCQAASITSALSANYGDGVLHPPGAGPSITLRSDGAGDDRAYALNADGWPPAAVYVSIDLSTELLLVARLTGGTLEIRNGNGTPSTMASGAGQGTTEAYRISGYADAYLDGAISHVLCWDRALTEGEISTVLAILGGTGGGAAGAVSYVGTSATTNANDAGAATGTVLNPVTGTSATTNANDTSTASGDVTGGSAVTGTSATTNANDAASASAIEAFVGTSATTNANDAATATGAVANPVTGTSATTNANDSPTASAIEAFVGTSATTNTNDAASATGAVANPVTGTSATTNANDAGTATGTVTEAGAVTGTSATTNANDAASASAIEAFVGTSATTNANDAGTATGAVANPVTGTSATTNANDAASASAIEAFVGTSATTNANDVASAAGAVANPVTGTSATTNANDTPTASGTVTGAGTVTGTSATTNANDAGTATGTEAFVGTSATTNANDAGTATGAVANPVTGTSATTNANDSPTATGTEAFVGTSATTNAADVASAAGAEAFVGTSATTNAADAGTATGTVLNGVTGTSATTNANDAGTATAIEAFVGTSATTNANDVSTANDFLPGGANEGVVVPGRRCAIILDGRVLGVSPPARRTVVSA